MFLVKLPLTVVLVSTLGLLVHGAGLVAQGVQPTPSHRLAEGIPADEQRPVVDRYGDSFPEQALARLGTVRLRHRSEAGAVAISPEFQGHQGAVICLAFSPDDRSLASGANRDRTLIVWDLATRKPMHLLPGHDPCVMSAVFSPDGKLLATGDGTTGQNDREAQVRLWDASRGQLVRQSFGHLNSVQSLAFSPDGKTLATAGWDARARLWDVTTGTRLHQIRGAACEKHVVFAPEGKALVVADNSGGTALWDLATGQKLRDLEARTDEGHRVLYAAFLPDRKTLLTVGLASVLVRDRRASPPGAAEYVEARFWDKETGRRLRTFPMTIDPHAPRRGFTCYALSPDGKTLATGDDPEPIIRLWDTAEGEQQLCLSGHTDRLCSLAFSPDSKTLASGSADTTVLLWDVSRIRLRSIWCQLMEYSTDDVQELRKLRSPERAFPVLRALLRRAAGLEGQVGSLVADLDSDQFAVRERASRDLESLGPSAKRALRTALAGRASPEARRRINSLLHKLKQAQGPIAPPTSLLLAILEELGTPESRLALGKLAEGAAESPVTREAKAALDRLAKQGQSVETNGP